MLRGLTMPNGKTPSRKPSTDAKGRHTRPSRHRVAPDARQGVKRPTAGHGARALAAARYASTQSVATGAVTDDLHADLVERSIDDLLREGRVPLHVAVRALENSLAEYEQRRAECGGGSTADEYLGDQSPGRHRRVG